MDITKLVDSLGKVSKVPTTAALSIAAILTAGCVLAIYQKFESYIILILIGSSFISLSIGILLYFKDQKAIERISNTLKAKCSLRKEPSLQQKGKENKMFETNYGYKIIEHYSNELDPKLSFITAIKETQEDFTDWFRVKDDIDPIESRFYIEEGAAIFELYKAKEDKIPIKCDKSYTLNKDESIIIPDSWWCRFKIADSQYNVDNSAARKILKMIVLCMPRWKEGSHQTAGDIRELVP